MGLPPCPEFWNEIRDWVVIALGISAWAAAIILVCLLVIRAVWFCLVWGWWLVCLVLPT